MIIMIVATINIFLECLLLFSNVCKLFLQWVGGYGQVGGSAEQPRNAIQTKFFLAKQSGLDLAFASAIGGRVVSSRSYLVPRAG